MNNQGQVVFLAFMIGVTILILALGLAGGLREQTDNARNSTNLDCGNSSISTFDKATCVVADANLFYFIVGLIGIAIAIIIARLKA